MQRGETVLAFFSVVAISTNPSTVNNGANVIKKSEGPENFLHRAWGEMNKRTFEQTNVEVRTDTIQHIIIMLNA